MQLPHYSPLVPFYALLRREIKRFASLWGQVIVTPIITTSLYFIIFGLSLGKSVSASGGVPYLHFILPGLVMMTIINSAGQSISFSVFLSKINGSIVDLLISPISYTATAFAYAIAGTIRGLVVGTMVMLVGVAFGGPLPAHPLLALFIAILTGWVFTIIGAMVGIWGKQFEHLNAFSTFILLPLIYLGGVFYSLAILPPVWQVVSKLNPILYIIDSFRYAFLGFSDLHPAYSVGVIFAVAAILSIVFIHILKRGSGLRS